VTIPSGVTVRFTRNSANTPVTILATGNVTIAGTIDLSGGLGGNAVAGTFLGSNAGTGGAGGFDGGNGANGVASTIGGSGLGPGGGGGGGSGAGAGFAATGTAGLPINATPGGAYGNAELLPLIGGSGGGGGGAGLGGTSAGGGGGGGAILIAASGSITLTGTINARGGQGGSGNNPGGGGSGGAVRLVATVINGTTGVLDVRGGAANSGIGVSSGAGSAGRIRIESYTNSATLNVNGTAPSIALPSAVALANGPVLAIATIGGIAVPAAPGASFAAPDVTLPSSTTNPVAVTLAGSNIPPGTSVTVTVIGQTGGSTSATTTLAGSMLATTASVALTIPTNRPSIVGAAVTFTLSAGSSPVHVASHSVR
jgi:hypothetical protein